MMGDKMKLIVICCIFVVAAFGVGYFEDNSSHIINGLYMACIAIAFLTGAGIIAFGFWHAAGLDEDEEDE